MVATYVRNMEWAYEEQRCLEAWQLEAEAGHSRRDSDVMLGPW
jgi:hypothetical protein